MGAGWRAPAAAAGLLLVGLGVALGLGSRALLAAWAGALLALLSWGAVILRARAITGCGDARSLLARTLSRLAAVLYYLVVAGLLWLAVTYLRAEVVWLAAAYAVMLPLLAVATAAHRRG